MATLFDQVHVGIDKWAENNVVLRLFGNSNSRLVANELKTLLKELNLDMGMREFAKHIASLEAMPLVQRQPTDPKTLGEWIARADKPTLDEVNAKFPWANVAAPSEVATTTTPLSPQSGSSRKPSFFDFLVDTHQQLLSEYKEAGLSREGKNPNQKVEAYSAEQLEESPLFKRIASDTSKASSGDSMQVVLDAKRCGMSFQGGFILPENDEEDNDYERRVRDTIQSMTGDEIDTPNSMANKVFNCGGQGLYALFGDVFNHEVTVAGTSPPAQKAELEEKNLSTVINYQGGVDGRLDWRTNEDKTALTGDVLIKIYACRYRPQEGADKGKQFVITLGADGKTALMDEMSSPLVEERMNKIKESKLRPGNEKDISEGEGLLPLCIMKATLEYQAPVSGAEKELTDPLHAANFKVTSFSMQLSTPLLVSVKAQEVEKSEPGRALRR